MKLWHFVFAFLLIFASCTDKKTLKREKQLHEQGVCALDFVQEIERKKSHAIDEYIATLTEQERLCQLFVLNLEGNEKFSFVEYVSENGKKMPLIPGGYIFFGFNIARSPQTIAAFTDSVKEFARNNNNIVPFLCLDAEGGYVNRLRGIAGELPENERVAQCLNIEQAEELYSLNALQLRTLGFDMNLAPVAEAVTAENEKFLDGRGFGDAQKAAEYSSAAVRGYQKNRVGAVVKHFPGNNDVDPHAALPRLFYTQKQLQKTVLEPFSAVIEEEPAGVLMSHALVETDNSSRQQSTVPAGLSEYWIGTVLRGQLGFKGIVFSDDIFMAALEQNGFPPEKAVHSAVLAGVNCILMSAKRFINEYGIVKKFYASDAAFKVRADESVRKVIEFKINCGILKYVFQRAEEVNSEQNAASLKIKVVESVTANENLSAEELRKERLEAFYNARAENSEIYKKYFLPTANADEIYAVRVDDEK